MVFGGSSSRVCVDSGGLFFGDHAPLLAVAYVDKVLSPSITWLYQPTTLGGRLAIIQPEDKQRDETFAAWRERTAGWRNTNKAAAEVEAARKALRAANSALAVLVDNADLPASQAARVKQWHDEVCQASSRLRELNLSEWRREVRAELAEQLQAAAR